MNFISVRAIQLSLIIYFMGTCAPLLALPECERIVATKGIEVEWQPVRANIERKGVNPLFEDMVFPFSREISDFNRMKLGVLFSLFGRDEVSGEWREHLLPKKVTESAEFKKLANPEPIPMPRFAQLAGPSEWDPDEMREYQLYSQKLREARLPFEVRQEGQHYYITNFAKLSGESLVRTLKFLFNLAGVDSRELVLEKRAEAWRDKTSPADLLIPKRVVIEQRNGQSAGLEFPMDGFVRTEKEARDYVKNLWIRLGLFEAKETELVEEAASMTDIHLHWVPDIQAQPRPRRKLFYERERKIFLVISMIKAFSLGTRGLHDP